LITPRSSAFYRFQTFVLKSSAVDPCLWPMNPDPDPAIFVLDLQDANKKLFFKKFLSLLLLKVHLYNFSKVKSHKEVTK
jgi:hypothetical protein